MFCDGCSKNKIKLAEEDGYGKEKVRVCQPCYEISTGKRQGVCPEPRGTVLIWSGSGAWGECRRPNGPAGRSSTVMLVPLFDVFQDRSALFSNPHTDSGLSSGLSSGWLGGGSDGHGKQMAAMDKEIAKLQTNALQNAARSIEQNADTLEMIVNQSGAAPHSAALSSAAPHSAALTPPVVQNALKKI